MAKNSPAFQFYPADFLVGTAAMTAAAVGVYIRLLSHQWAMRTLADDPEVLSRICFVTRAEFDAVWGEIEGKFDRVSKGQIRNARLAQVMENAENLREKRQIAGRKGAEVLLKQTGKQKGSKGRVKNEDRSMKFSGEEEDWILPAGWDTPEVRNALDDWATMRRRIGKPVKSKASTSKIFKRFDSPEHLAYAAEFCESNEYQGLKPDYRQSPQRNGHQPKTFRQIEAEQTAMQRERFLGGKDQKRLETK